MPGSFSNLVLVGFTGAGKSTVGRILSERLGRRYFDIDERIEARAGPIPALIAAHGVSGFRRLEREIVEHEMPRLGAVVAAGAGTVLPEATAAVLLRDAVACFLDAPPAVLHARLLALAPGRRHRPDFCGEHGLAALSEELAWRRPLYESIACRVDATGTPEAVAEEVIRATARPG